MRKSIQWLALLAALVLMLALPAGCGGQDGAQPPVPDPAPAAEETDKEKEPPVSDPSPAENQQPQDVEPVESEPAEKDETQPSGDETVDVQPDEPAPEPEEPAADPEPAAEPTAAPEPESDPETEPESEPEPEPAETVPEDGTYTASVTLEGGTGRAKIDSPATLRCEGGKFYAIIAWSSPNFDYMKVDGEKYLQTNTEGNSTFEIPVAAFDQKLDVIADTVAMSEPHEVEYTLYFDSSTLQKQ